MPISVRVSVVTKVIRSDELNHADAEAFTEFVPSGRMEYLEVQHDAPKMLPKENKELRTFCSFVKAGSFKEVIHRITGHTPPAALNIEILSSSRGEDPPDLVLTLAGIRLGIEIADFPPDGALLANAIVEANGPGALPTFHEGACSPSMIREFIEKPISLARPHFASAEMEIEALKLCAINLIEAKDRAGKADVLLLSAPVAFSWPTNEVIAGVISAVELNVLPPA